MIHTIRLLLWAAAFLCASVASGAPTNVVLIMTDNHGAWTLGCYGNPDIRTPNIDRLARQGVRFTRAFSSNAVCSPTRATYLTGLLPSQHGVHCYLRADEAQVGENAYSTIGEFRTLPEILHDAGYVCGLAGKWHLGNNAEPQEGFSSWITMPHGHTTTFYDAEVIRDGRIEREPQYLTQLWTDNGARFIEENRQRPFFLFLSYNGPYGLGASFSQPARNRHAEYYAGQDLLSFPRARMHPWLVSNKQYLNNVEAMRRVAAEVSGVDDGVGVILETLDRLDLATQTLVIFAGDQGWAGGQNGLWGMGDHSRPLHAFDSTMHIPLIFRHSEHIPAEVTSELMTSNYDLLPTVLSYLQLSPQLPDDPKLPGRDYSGALRGQQIPWENEVFYEFENVRAIRTPDWKYIERFPEGPHELYDLAQDPGEQFNLYGQPRQQETQRALRDRLYEFFHEYASDQFDLWNGGRSKPRLATTGQHTLTP